MLTASSEDAEFFFRLLHLNHAVPQLGGKYAGRRRIISPEDIASHLRGEVSLAFCISTKYETGNKRWARFIAIDIDKKLVERLPVFAEVLAGLGIAEAAFATGGSSPEKGKVVITFAKFVNREEANALAQLIHSEAHRLNPGLIPAKPSSGDIELFPKMPTSIAWDGGLVRILGRNIGRDGPLETSFDLDGCAIDLHKLKPLAQSRVSRLSRGLLVAKREKARPQWVDRLTKQSWTWACFGGVKEMRSKMFALARYYMTSFGSVKGRTAYVAALTEIRKHSADLDSPSPKNSDRRNPVGREIEQLTAWGAALLSGAWEPLELQLPINRPPSPGKSNGECPAVPGSAQRVYTALAQHVRDEGLRPHCFGIDQRTLAGRLRNVKKAATDLLAERLGIDKKAVSDALALAERYGLLVRLHPGTSNSEVAIYGNGELESFRRSVKAGVPAMYGLVGKGETIYDVYADAIQDPYLKERRAKFPVQKIMPETLAVIGQLVVESSLGNLSPHVSKPKAA